MTKKEFETELHKIDPKLILTVLAHRGADKIDYYDGCQKVYKVFSFRNGLYYSKGTSLLSINQFNQLRNLLLKAHAFIRGRNTFDDMNIVIDDSHNAKKLNNRDNPFKECTDHLADVLQSKNTAYGDSFTKSVDEDGLLVLKIRLGDKFNRVSSLIKKGELKENDESLKDTLLDLAGYSILGLKYLKEHKNE
jgi:hypothetical protein